MHRYPADSTLIQSRLRGTNKMAGLAIFLLIMGVAVFAGFTIVGRLTWMNGILAALLVLVSALLLVRVRSTRARMTANIGSEFAVTDLGLTLFQTGTIPWAQITNIGIIDTPHQLQQDRAGLATGAGFGVYAVSIIVSDAAAARTRYGKAITVGPHDMGFVSVDLDSVLGLDAARDAIAQTIAAATAQGIPVKALSSSGESFSFVFDVMGEQAKKDG